MSAPVELDAIDLRVLRALQANGRATYDELAAQVSLSPSATLRRVKRLEEAGVIDRLRGAGAARERSACALTAYINVRLEKHTESHKRNPMDAVPRGRAGLARGGRMRAR